jgi:hypothetical protein
MSVMLAKTKLVFTKVYNIVLLKHSCQTTSLIFMTYVRIIPNFHGSINTSDKDLVIKPVSCWKN